MKHTERQNLNMNMKKMKKQCATEIYQYYGVSSCSDECDCNILTFKSNLTNKHRVDKIG